MAPDIFNAPLPLFTETSPCIKSTSLNSLIGGQPLWLCHTVYFRLPGWGREVMLIQATIINNNHKECWQNAELGKLSTQILNVQRPQDGEKGWHQPRHPDWDMEVCHISSSPLFPKYNYVFDVIALNSWKFFNKILTNKMRKKYLS